jgi:WD40 repeat protein
VKCFSCKNGNVDLNSEAILIESSNQITKIKVSSDGNYLASGDSEGKISRIFLSIGNIQIMDLKARENICNFSFNNQKITSLHFVPGKQIVASSDSVVKLIDFSGRIIIFFTISGKEKLSLQISSKYGNVTDMEFNGGNFIVCKFFFYK